MITLLPKKFVDQLQNSLTEKRFAHSLGVMQTAFQLADAWIDHPVDRTALAWASLFHDCGKEIPKDQRKHLTSNGLILYGKELLEVTKLNHAPLGALLLQDHYGITQQDILMAVAYHPTGHRNLTPIGWMVYIADLLEPNRTFLPDRAKILKKTCADPLFGLKMITKLRFEAVQGKNKPILPVAMQFKKYLDQIDSL